MASRTAPTAPTDEQFALHFSNERTFLAWIRTSTALMGFGYAVSRFALYLSAQADSTGRTTTYYGGLAMTCAGIIALALAAIRYRANGRGIDRGTSPRTHEGYIYVFALLIGAIGLLLLLLLFSGR